MRVVYVDPNYHESPWEVEMRLVATALERDWRIDQYIKKTTTMKPKECYL
jgi:hypothetical protein